MSLAACYEYAMNYIYRFPKSEKELRVQLLKKGFNDAEVDETIDMLKKKKFVNDKQFAELYINSEVVKKGKPLIAIKAKLFQKGVDKSIVNEVLKEVEEEVSSGVQNQIKKEIEKYKAKGVDGFEIIQKLARKGYSIDDIKKAI